MPSPLISVIVPIYNMESLLPRCLDSLAAQTLRDLEIICVDDGSTDGFPGPSPAAAASPSPLKNSTTTGWAVPNPFLLATGKRKPGPQVITPYSRCSPGKNSGKGFWAATARPT